MLPLNHIPVLYAKKAISTIIILRKINFYFISLIHFVPIISQNHIFSLQTCLHNMIELFREVFMNYKRIFRFLLVILVTFIIFNFSLKPSYVSDVQSGLFVNIALAILKHTSLDIDVLVLTIIIRKCAHFIEYGCLGTVLSWFIHSLPANKASRYIYAYAYIIPIIDEIIQAFVPGRSCQVSDMLLDMAGASTGILFIYIVYRYFVKRSVSSEQ